MNYTEGVNRPSSWNLSETFVTKQCKDSDLSNIYNEILAVGHFPNYFIHPDSKVWMFEKKQDVI